VTPAAASKTYGTADPALTGTLSGFVAGDGVTATYSRVAGETVAGGPYTISATLSPAAVLANYAITSTTAAFTITAKAASVTPAAASKTYGTADPALTGTLSGFVAADGVTATYSRTAGEIVAGSPYPISATLSPAGVLANYAVTSNTASFTISKAAATVTAGGGTKVSGTADPALSATTATGFTAADAPTIALTSTRAPGEAVGIYATTATATGAALSNYTVTYVPGTFTITAATGNHPPVAVNDSYTTNQATALNVAAPGVLANDTDVDPGDTMTAVLVGAPAHGTLTLNANGSFRYTPSASYSGTDTFRYQAKDAAGALSNIATVSIAITPFSAASIAPVNDATVAANDSYTPTGAAVLAVLALGGVPAHGTLTLSATGSFSDSPNGILSGPETFHFKAKDVAALSNVATMMLDITPLKEALEGRDGDAHHPRGERRAGLDQ
jgi:VCBS repeat-containing protein